MDLLLIICAHTEGRAYRPVKQNSSDVESNLDCLLLHFSLMTYSTEEYNLRVYPGPLTHALRCDVGHFGLFEGDASTVFFEVQTQLTNHVAAIVPAAVIGLVCGLLGTSFTVLNLRVMRFREAVIGVRIYGPAASSLFFTYKCISEFHGFLSTLSRVSRRHISGLRTWNM